MTDFVHAHVRNQVGYITLDRPKALHSLSLDMVRAITGNLLAWRGDPAVSAVVIRGSGERAFCAGGDIRFFHECGIASPREGSALLEDFFTEEYALNHLIHFYPKPYIAVMDGIVMGGGMGVAQAGPITRLRIVTERTKMAMPEVNIGLFPDVGASYFLSRTPGEIGTYLGLTGEIIGAADAIHAGLADVFVPSSELAAFDELLDDHGGQDLPAAIHAFAQPFAALAEPSSSALAGARAAIDRHFAHDSVALIATSLAEDEGEFARKTLAVMKKRSPLMMWVTLAQLRRGVSMNLPECLRMERMMVRRCFEHGEVLEGIRAVVIDKDHAPHWSVDSIDQVCADTVARFFEPAWPEHAHPLRDLRVEWRG